MNKLLIKTTALSYSFSKELKTLDKIDLQVQQGSIYGFLGPNGAGKTTTLRLLLGLLTKQEGSIEVFGEEFHRNRIGILKKIGSLIEQPSLYNHLTARENLNIYRKIYGCPANRIDEVLQLVGLAHTKNKKAKQFSLGMKQRLSIALALLPQPQLLILDEPTNGLDPNGIIETRELIKTLNREHGTTILVSSHILAEVERMATHVGIIHHGKMKFQGTLHELHQLQVKESFLTLETDKNEFAGKLLKEHFEVTRQNGHLLLPFKDREQTAFVNRLLVQNGIDVYRLQPQQNDLEQLFIDITSTTK
jgi:ABC-2 type transport system ATP-binding protein